LARIEIGLFPEWTWVLGLLLGAIAGSFLNMLVYRLPRGLSLTHPGSSCPTCGHRLGIPDLFPLLSWLILGGKCRYCKAKIGPRYFVVELICGAIWAALWWQYLIATWNPALGIAYALFATALFAALVTDLEHYLIPDEINAFLLIVGLGYHAIFGSITFALLGAFTGWAIVWGVSFLGRVAFGKDAMGHGDIKMARGMGAMLGPTLVAAAFFIAVLIGVVVGIPQAIIRARRVAEPEPELGEYEPESIGSLVRCGLGYLLCIDVLSLAWPKIGKAWFGDTEQAEEEMDDWTPDLTAIPFGPYLAVGAVAAAVFAIPLQRFLVDWFTPAGGQPAMLEHLILVGGPTYCLGYGALS
jgi:leader peptidase (prepilin peptidase)/N-methyltransferase